MTSYLTTHNKFIGQFAYRELGTDHDGLPLIMLTHLSATLGIRFLSTSWQSKITSLRLICLVSVPVAVKCRQRLKRWQARLLNSYSCLAFQKSICLDCQWAA